MTARVLACLCLVAGLCAASGVAAQSPCPGSACPRERLGPAPARSLVATDATAAAFDPDGTPQKPQWLVPTLHSGAVVVGVYLAAMAIWPETYDVTDVSGNWERFKRAWSRPPLFDESQAFFEWDRDPWPINLVGHALMGSEFHLVHRRAGHPLWQSLAMTVVWTFVWEYLVESWHKHPSSVDLAWTPAGGLLLGEARYQAYRAIRRMQPSAGRHVLLYLVDPLGQLERDLIGLSY